MTHALVEWLNEAGKFSVVAVNQIEDNEKINDFEKNAAYKVRFGNKKYLAKLLMIGTKAVCDTQLENITKTQKDTSPKKTANTLKTKTLQQQNQYELQINLLSEENSIQKRKIEEQSNIIENLQAQNEAHVNELNQLKSINQQLDRTKLLQIATTIINTFGTPSELANLNCNGTSAENCDRMVQLTPNFPNFLIPLPLMQTVTRMKANEKSATVIYRTLVKSLIPDETIWADRNNGLMCQDYPIILKACNDYLFSVFPNFDKAGKTLREICSEARENIARRDPQAKFKNPLNEKAKKRKREDSDANTNETIDANTTVVSKPLNTQDKEADFHGHGFTAIHYDSYDHDEGTQDGCPYGDLNFL